MLVKRDNISRGIPGSRSKISPASLRVSCMSASISVPEAACAGISSAVASGSGSDSSMWRMRARPVAATTTPPGTVPWTVPSAATGRTPSSPSSLLNATSTLVPSFKETSPATSRRATPPGRRTASSKTKTGMLDWVVKVVSSVTQRKNQKTAVKRPRFTKKHFK